MEKRRLGRGLDALLGNNSTETEPTGLQPTEISVEQIVANPFQPRKGFDADELSALGKSIRNHGILQPLVVRCLGEGYQLVAGERRLRAAQAVGITQIPVRIVDFNDQQVLEAALVENIHRSDLNPIEKALGFKEHLDNFGMTQEQLAEKLGLDRTTISNLVNLLHLPIEVQDAVRSGQISLGHAKLLKGLNDPERQIALCKEIVSRGHSVKATEALIREEKPEKAAASAKPAVEKTSHVRDIEDNLRKKLATPVEIKLKGKDRGQIVLTFESNDDFERLLEVLKG